MKFLNSILAGFFASSGSVFAKLSSNFESEESSFVSIQNSEPHNCLQTTKTETTDASWNVFIYVSFMALMILCNSIGLFFFTKSLHNLDSTVVATLASTVSNYIHSGIMGIVFFDETLSWYWFIGCIFAVIGILFAASEEARPVQDKND